MVNAVAACHAMEEAPKNLTICPQIPLSPELALSHIPEVRMTTKSKCFELIEDIEAAVIMRLKILTEEDSQSRFRKRSEQSGE